MSGCFLDSTIVVHMSQDEEPARTDCQLFVNANQPAQVPFYASREILAGLVRYHCDAHNYLRSAQTHGEAFVALMQIPAVAGRKRDTAM